MADAIRNAKTFHLKADSTTDPDPIEGDVVHVGTQRTDMDLESKSGGLRLVDGNLYFDSSADAADPSKPWVLVSKDSKSPFAGIMMLAGSMILTATGADADTDEKIFRAGTGTFVADESDGAHYRIVVPADRYFDAAFGGLQESLSAAGLPSAAASSVSSDFAKEKAKLAGKQVTYDVWVDDQMRPAKMRADQRALSNVFDDSTGGSGGDGVIVSTYSRWGVPASVSAPPAAKTQSIDEAMNGLFSDLPTDLPSDLPTDLPSESGASSPA